MILLTKPDLTCTGFFYFDVMNKHLKTVGLFIRAMKSVLSHLKSRILLQYNKMKIEYVRQFLQTNQETNLGGNNMTKS